MAGVVSQTKAISLLVSDVDGTLVTHDKFLTEATIAAAHRLLAAGVKLSLVSSRPPVGFAMLSGPLGLQDPIGAYNGGAIVRPDLSVIEATYVPEEAARIAIDAFAAFGLDCWIFNDKGWHVVRDDGPYVAKERRTLQATPIVVTDFSTTLTHIGKLVGSSGEFDRVAACEATLSAQLGTRATARRSQAYYLDVTPFGFDKGEAVRRIAHRLSIPLEETAVIGDQANDLPMFAIAGTRIAMGNAIDDVKAMAEFVTRDNEQDGWAAAIDDYVLPHAKGRP
jgi:Cof subfamily protein (haloacid dehalogenase superfamily)